MSMLFHQLLSAELISLIAACFMMFDKGALAFVWFSFFLFLFFFWLSVLD